jgi:predicted DsbA family dithiol-disulfide isomerase
MDVAPGTLVVYGDIACPWSTACLWNLHRARREAGLEGRVWFDLRAFPLELVNERPTPRPTLDAEVPVAGRVAPGLGWRVWQDRTDRYPVTTLLALEAVQAAKEQGPRASEALDLALRRALFAESRCISLRSVVLDVADACEAVDAATLADALDQGRARRLVIQQWKAAGPGGVAGSPHVFCPDGTGVMNPAMSMHWEGEEGVGFPVVDDFRPEAYDDLLARAAA